MQPYNANNMTNDTVAVLLQLIDTIVSEVHPDSPSNKTASLDSSFEKDLGLDSLTRVELISRIEKAFKLALPEQIYAEAESARDLLRAIEASAKQTAVSFTADIESVELDDTQSTPDESSTLIELLNWHVNTHPDRPHIQLYTDEGDGERITYQQLKNKALQVAGGLQQRGLQPAEPVALMLPSCAEYFYSFFGILLAGGIPVPLYPPVRLSQLEDHIRRHVRILSNCLAKTFITVSEARSVAHLLKSQVPNIKHIVTAKELIESSAITLPPVISPTDIAFIQYTSGSTGNPKGVVLSHANILTNIRAMGDVVQANSRDVFVSWLPLYHDMGLIGAWLGSLYYAALFVVMSPLSFLTRPERWLWAINKYRGTLSASPNFGYEYCVRRIKPECLDALDLSSWRAAFNGAESVSPETLSNFCQHFKHYGFKQTAMMPVYGLAESTVGLSFPPIERGALIDAIDRSQFMNTGIARPVATKDEHALRFVASGPPLKGHQIRVIDPGGHELPERHEGRLEFRGPSSTTGYYRNPEQTRTLFNEEWLDSGDLAYIANGELYVTGRTKDIIIRAGRNIYPHELEQAVGNMQGIRTGRVAVFGSEDKHTKTERLIVMAETRCRDEAELDQLRTEVNTLATDLIGSPPDLIALVPPGTILKTSSGKIRRAASKELFEQGKVGKTQALYWQLTRVAFSSIAPVLRRFWRHGKSVAFALYCWLVYTILATIVWFATMFLPSFKLRWASARTGARLLQKLTGTKLTVNGLENIPQDGQAYVLVSNHASYLDSYVLLATLPDHPRFIGKKELEKYFFNRIPLKNINTEFVDRFDMSKSIKDTQHLVDVLKTGNPLIFFAEGTFTRIPGLKPFHLGAFTVAAEAQTPVIPVAVRGTRSILRSGSWFPHYGSINLEIGKPINPSDLPAECKQDTWHTALELRNKSREFILRHCGEPDLNYEAK